MNWSFSAVRALLLALAVGASTPPLLPVPGSSAAADHTEEYPSAADVYARVAPAIVGLSCRLGTRGRYFGTGVLIDPSGLILTSVTVVPPGARSIRVYLRGGREAAARLLLTDEARELALVEIHDVKRIARKKPLPHLKLGDSREVRLGDPVYTLGNSFQSIENDDQVSVASGIVSGFFRLKEKLSESTYVGNAVETTAA